MNSFWDKLQELYKSLKLVLKPNYNGEIYAKLTIILKSGEKLDNVLPEKEAIETFQKITHIGNDDDILTIFNYCVVRSNEIAAARIAIFSNAEIRKVAMSAMEDSPFE